MDTSVAPCDSLKTRQEREIRSVRHGSLVSGKDRSALYKISGSKVPVAALIRAVLRTPPGFLVRRQLFAVSVNFQPYLSEGNRLEARDPMVVIALPSGQRDRGRRLPS